MFGKFMRQLLVGRFRRNEGGTSAVEFGMIAPLLIFSAILTVDVGMAVRERMELDHIVRAGAESVMIKHDEAKVLKVMRATADQNFGAVVVDGEVQSSSPVSLLADRYCACGATVTSCSSACTTDLPPDVLFDLNARKTFSGMLLPDLNFDAQMQVQLR
ncbi:MAG: pilus assembly protein [Boseongicola sp.]